MFAAAGRCYDNHTVEIRRYRSADRDAVWRLHNDALHAVGAHWGEGLGWDDDLHEIERVYFDSGGDFFVGEIDGRIVAMGGLRPTDRPGRAEVTRMRVAPDLHRRGLGWAMLTHLLERARQLGLSELELETTSRQTPAIAMYKKAGFTETGRYRRRGFEIAPMIKRL